MDTGSWYHWDHVPVVMSHIAPAQFKQRSKLERQTGSHDPDSDQLKVQGTINMLSREVEVELFSLQSDARDA